MDNDKSQLKMIICRNSQITGYKITQKGNMIYLIRVAINIPIYNRNNISYYDTKPLSIKMYDKNNIQYYTNDI